MYEFVEHPSEEMIRIRATKVEEVFIDAAKALFELMTDIHQVRAQTSFHVRFQAADRLLLLVDWLNQLILLHEVEKVFLSNFDVEVDPGEIWNMNATVSGEHIRDTMERRLHAKSATYGQLKWDETPGGHEVQFVIDI